MSKTIIVVGFGPGISTATARKFGAEGFHVALVGRSQARLESGAALLTAEGITAAAFPADAGAPDAMGKAIREARAALGPIAVLHWNAFGGAEAGDLLTAPPAVAGSVFNVAVVGLLAAVQEALPDLKQSEGAVLVTNGAFADNTPETDQYAVSLNTMGVALANAAKYKLVGLLTQRLKPEGIYVGEVMIAGTIQGTPWDSADSIDPATVAEKFWVLYQTRGEVRARISA